MLRALWSRILHPGKDMRNYMLWLVFRLLVHRVEKGLRESFCFHTCSKFLFSCISRSLSGIWLLLTSNSDYLCQSVHTTSRKGLEVKSVMKVMWIQIVHVSQFDWSFKTTSVGSPLFEKSSREFGFTSTKICVYKHGLGILSFDEAVCVICLICHLFHVSCAIVYKLCFVMNEYFICW